MGGAVKHYKDDYNQSLKALVYHYNTTTKTWDSCWSEIQVIDGTDNAKITFKFDSYSPIYIAITNASKTTSGEKLNTIAYTDTPQQEAATAPKTGENANGWLFVLGVAVVGAAVVSRKRIIAK